MIIIVLVKSLKLQLSVYVDYVVTEHLVTVVFGRLTYEGHVITIDPVPLTGFVVLIVKVYLAFVK